MEGYRSNDACVCVCKHTHIHRVKMNSLGLCSHNKGFPGGSDDNLPAMQETQVLSLGREDPLEKKMAPHSGLLAWRIPWTEEPGRIRSTGLNELRSHRRV